jgi:hypothetical protein
LLSNNANRHEKVTLPGMEGKVAVGSSEAGRRKNHLKHPNRALHNKSHLPRAGESVSSNFSPLRPPLNLATFSFLLFREF